MKVDSLVLVLHVADMMMIVLHAERIVETLLF